ncbi:hypothetical protein Tco_0428085 [Tanacetum coccineum]
MESSDPVDTPIVEKSKLEEDTQGKVVDPTHYRGMIGNLMYLTASRPDLTFTLMQTLITRVAKILDEVLLDVCNYWETDLLAGHQKDHSLPTIALDSTKFQCTVITKVLLPYAATMFNILDRSILTSDSTSSKSNNVFTPETLKQLIDEAEE